VRHVLVTHLRLIICGITSRISMNSTNGNNADASDPFMSNRRLIKATSMAALIIALLIGITPVKQTSVSSSILVAPLVW
ncbi:MAG: hypothetical protein WA667_11070, partial [Candidatus Nitrosopolaris sp.]